MGTRAVSFGHITFDTELGLLSRDGVPLTVSHRAIALLRSPVEHRGQPVSKATLSEAAWSGQIVEEGNLTVQIAALRKALGPMPDGNDWIVTVPRVGYRLLRENAPMPIQTETVVLPSLAVLPFENLSGNPDQDYFADGVVEDIISALSRFKSFAVIARNSSFAFKGKAVDVRQVASDLGVFYVLEGSIRRAGGRLRIGTRLIDCSNGQTIWAEHYEGAVEEVFEFQDRITESVAVLVEPLIQRAEIERSRRERPGSIAAYDLYLRASSKFLFATDTGNREVVALLTEALKLDPDNAIYLAMVASSISDRTIMGWSPLGPDDRQLCVDYVSRALANAGRNATVLTHCGNTLLHFLKDYDWAISTIQSAMAANPNDHWVVIHAGVMNLHCGSVAESLDLFHRAIRLGPHDPYAFVSLTGISHCHMMLGDFDEALVWAIRSLTLNPNYPCTWWMLIAANALLGRMDEARRHLATFRLIVPEMTVARIRDGQPDRYPERIGPLLEGLRMAGLPEK
jgi:TolB-like protein